MQQIAPGELFIEQGRTPDWVYVITSGCAEIPNKRENITRTSGEIIGEMSLLEPDSLATADVHAGDQGCSVVCIPRELVAKLPRAVEMIRKRKLQLSHQP